jgi:Zn-dependent peptidase ImmA (M78 family)
MIDPLDPCALAEHLAIPVLPLSGLAGCDPAAVRHLQVVEPEVFSAVTVFRGLRRTIVHNDAHNAGRQANNITHELSHGLLLHQPTPAVDDRGNRLWDQVIEDEASLLAAILLLPQEACIDMARRGIADAGVAERFGVSIELARWRMGASAARTIISRSRSKRA